MVNRKGSMERKPEDGIKRIKAKSSAPFQEKGNRNRYRRKCMGLLASALVSNASKRLNQSGLVPLKRVKLEKVKQPMYRAKGKAAP